MFKQKILLISLLVSLCGTNTYPLMRSASRFSRRMKCIREEFQKHRNRLSKDVTKLEATIEDSENDDAKICCTPETTKSILALLSGLSTIVVTIIKLVSK